MQKVIPFQVRLMEDINRQIKIDAANKNLTKHEWIEKAINEKLLYNGDKFLDLLERAYHFVEGGPSTKLENDLKEYCDLLSGR